MRLITSSRIVGLSILIAACYVLSTAHAQQTVYRYVDEDGNVTYSDQAPSGVKEAEAIELVVPQPTTQPQASPAPTPSPPTAKSKSPTPRKKAPPSKEVSAGSMSLEELDRRCDQARERRIAPLRQAEIEKCKAEGRNDPGYCERFYSDYGDGGRTQYGTIRPRMFDDLPECVQVLNERNERSRGTREKQR